MSFLGNACYRRISIGRKNFIVSEDEDVGATVLRNIKSVMEIEKKDSILRGVEVN